MFPLVAYDLSTQKEEFTLFVSLLESTFANSSTKVYWLKIALVTEVEDCNPQELEDLSEKRKQMLTLGYLSNAVGRLTIPVSDDWVELSSVSSCDYV